jgi:3-deoxy-7-phosphoheptulonate synthase
MRVYFEKPRTRKGWKGFIYDPDLDESFQINKGLDLARSLMLELTKLRIPIGTEFLDTITPQYLADLVSWGAIGARTSESQIHRQLASGLSMPIGFKNLTSGDYEKAIDGIIAAKMGHNFLGIDSEGRASHVITSGNPTGHLILRGGLEPNYDEETLSLVTKSLRRDNIQTGFIVDCSHGNSKKEYTRQILVALHVKRMVSSAKYPIRGIMLESHIDKGNQPMYPIVQGISITDACIDIETTHKLLGLLNSQKNVAKKTETVQEIRELIRKYDIIINNILIGDIALDIDIIPSKYCIEEDANIMEICKNHKYSELLLMMISTRISFSNRLAEIKFANNPFAFLQNDPMTLITDRFVEKAIVGQFTDPIFLKIIEISKTVQMRCLEKLLLDFRIGYTDDSFEALKKMGGTHLLFPKLDSMICNSEIDAYIVPTYNSLIGELNNVNRQLVCGTIDCSLRLCVFSNVRPENGCNTVFDRFFIDSVTYQQCKKYIEKNIRYKEIEIVASAKHAYLAVSNIALESLGIERHEKSKATAVTICLEKYKSIFLETIHENVAEHNITTYSLVLNSQKMPQSPTSEFSSSCIDYHYC